MVPGWVEMSSPKKMPRWPPASAPCADDGVTAALGQPARLLGRGRGREDNAARRLDPLDEVRCRQSEVKAYHRRLQVLDRLAHGRVEGCAVDGRRLGVGIESEFVVVRRQPGRPGGGARRVGLGRRVAEEVDAERLRRLLADDADFSAHGVCTDHGAGQAAEASGFARRDDHGRSVGARHHYHRCRHAESGLIKWLPRDTRNCHDEPTGAFGRPSFRSR